jgi:caa(3)-type oxidase subunit IV
MVQVHSKPLLLCGIGIKSTIICLWFMHLKHESKLLTFSVALGFAFAAFLFFLIHFDVKVP